MVRYWVVRMSMKSDDNTSLDWEIGKKNNFVGIGWSRAGDLTNCTKEELRNKLRVYKPKTSGTLNNWVSHIYSFVNRIEGNDIVFVPIYDTPDGYIKKYLIGKVALSTQLRHQPYFDEKSTGGACDLRRDVKWLDEITIDRLSPRLKKSLESPHTVYNIDKYENEIKALLLADK
jgi:predicted Mrr-cat superfamily restriction endonuclease